MSDQTPDLAALEALAEAAKLGPLETRLGKHRDLIEISGRFVIKLGNLDRAKPEQAEFIAQAPATVLWLIRELRDAHAGLTAAIAQRDEQEVFAKRAEAELASIRAAARPDRFRCCECCKTEHLAEGREGDDDLIDNHTIACQHCQDPEKCRAEKAEATIERVRVLAKALQTGGHGPCGQLIDAALDGGE